MSKYGTLIKCNNPIRFDFNKKKNIQIGN